MNFSKKFSKKLENITFEEKKILFDVLVESVEVEIIDEQQRVRVNYQFEQPSDLDETQVLESKEVVTERKKASEKDTSNFDGGD